MKVLLVLVLFSAVACAHKVERTVASEDKAEARMQKMMNMEPAGRRN